MLVRFLLALCLCSLLGAGKGFAQDDDVFPRERYYQSTQQEHTFSKERWLEVIKDIDYSESVRAERQEDENIFTTEEERRKSRDRYRGQQNNTSAFWAMILKFLIIAAGVILVAVIIARFLGPEGLGKPRSRNINQQLEIQLENIEDNIHESDLDRFIHEALVENNYNLAIRLYYLAIIKELSLSKTIRWKRDKTNRDYLRELSGHPLLPEFRRLTAVYEYAWYGDRTLSETDFNLLRPRFEQMVAKAQQTRVPVV